MMEILFGNKKWNFWIVAGYAKKLMYFLQKSSESSPTGIPSQGILLTLQRKTAGMQFI